MKISKREVEKISTLARLGLDKKEIKKFSKELSTIIDYIGKLNELDTKGIEPTSQVTGLENVLRKDIVIQQDCQTEILENSPNIKDNYIKVKKVFEN